MACLFEQKYFVEKHFWYLGNASNLSGKMVALVRKCQNNFRDNLHDFVRKYTISLKNMTFGIIIQLPSKL